MEQKFYIYKQGRQEYITTEPIAEEIMKEMSISYSHTEHRSGEEFVGFGNGFYRRKAQEE